MKETIWTLAARFGIFAALMAACLGAGYLLNTAMNSGLDYNLAPEVETVIIGDSRPNTGLNEAWISNSRNMSIRGEATFSTFFKLKHFLERKGERNSALKTVVCGFSFHNLSGVNDRWIVKREMAHNYFEKYIWITPASFLADYPYHQRAYRVQFFKQKVLPSLQYLNYGIFSPAKDPAYHKLPWVGRFRENYESLMDRKDIKKQMKKLFGPPADTREPSWMCVAYLDSIIDLCAEYGLELYIIHLPYHREFYDRVPQNIRAVYDSTIANAAEREAVQILEYSADLLPDDHFFDHGHLNTKGAKIYSARLDSLLNAP